MSAAAGHNYGNIQNSFVSKRAGTVYHLSLVMFVLLNH